MPGRDGAAGRVDVEEDLLVGVLGREQQQLGADLVRHLVLDDALDEDDPVAEQPLVDRVAEAEPAAARGGTVVGEHHARRAVRLCALDLLVRRVLVRHARITLRLVGLFGP